MSGAVSFGGICTAGFFVHLAIVSFTDLFLSLFEQTDLAGLNFQLEAIDNLAAAVLLLFMQVAC